MSGGQSSRQQMLDSIIGKSVAVQANAGFLEMWKRSDLYMSIVNDEKLFEFLALMSQINDADMDDKMQEFYVAVQSYNADVGHVNDVEKIQKCLEKALDALAIKKIAVADVVKIRASGTASQASPERVSQEDNYVQDGS